MDKSIKILCVDDEKNVLRALQRLFMDEDYEIFTADSGEEGIQICEDEPGIQLVISDYRMPGMDGVDFFKIVNSRWPETIRIVLSGYADTASVVGAINEGQIYKFIAKPWNDEELKVTIGNALEVFFLHQKNKQLHEELLSSNEKLKHLNENLEQLVEKKAEEVIFQNRILMLSQNILDALPVGVLGMDDTGLIVHCNKYAEKLFKGNKNSVVYLTAHDGLPPEILAIIDHSKESGFSM